MEGGRLRVRGAGSGRERLSYVPGCLRQLLAGVQQPLRVEGKLDLFVQLERPRGPLAGELPALEPADPVLAADRAAELDGERKELLDGGARRGQILRGAGVNE